uniref:NADH-ubiquinone oxidoreductase chain 5 n=1 Tax=Opistoplatys sp. HL-2013 TaxID=1347747 RepID=A0A7I6HBR6_9HEMI|nr:NADH dehydrogenase subunit 5 [Opistoplatys sp. HL-2013]
MFLYKMGMILFLFFGSSFFFAGVYFSFYECNIFIDWEIININSCSIIMTILLDWMSLMFTGCVFLISSMVIYYSHSYMMSDINKVRFYFLVFMFIMSMMMMIISPNLMSILIGWDGLGLVSYCLVIYFQNYKSYSAGMLTILTNRLGDVAILLSIGWMLNFGSWNYMYYCIIDDWGIYVFIMIIVAGFTKSAQIPFSSWLPAAMAAPTPVSSLVHSSTLVTAGVYLLIRFYVVFSTLNLSFILLLSVLTMFMSGLGANFEFDLKKIIALSTLSQLGLMMSVLMMGFPLMAFFHLLTHAFFKALLFLCAGLIIHCCNDSQDIRHMGVIVNQLPFTCTCFCISNMALCGFPFMSGFYSKDMILEMMMMTYYNGFIFLMFFISVGLTVMYSLRLIYYCFSFNLNNYCCQNYEEDNIMVGSMVLLTIMAIIGGAFISWIIFKFPLIIFLTVDLSILSLLLISLGGWLGYELSSSDYLFLSHGLRLYLVYFFSGSMWFMPYFSTYFSYKQLMIFSKEYYELMDGGWGEYMISQSFYLASSYISKLYNYYSFNNLSMFMFIFLLIILIMLF